MMKKQLKTQEIIERLGRKYPSPQYGFITQVRSATGFTDNRTADAIAMSLWPSRGLQLYGFEVKASRADWLGELKNPAKAEEIAKFCHYWYIVVGDKDIIKEGELPQNWGLIVPYGKGLKIVKEAPYVMDAKPVNYSFLAGIFRNIAEQCIPKESLKTILDKKFEAGERSAGFENTRLKEDLKKKTDMIGIFERASGVELSFWDIKKNKDIGKAVKDVLNGRDKEAKQRLEKLLVKAKNIVKYIEGEDISGFDC